MSKHPTSIRIPTELKAAMEARAREVGLSPSALLERFLAEGLRRDAHPLIAFRDGAGGRRAALIGTRLAVADVIDTVDASPDRGDAAIREAAEYLCLHEGQVRACVRYYAEYKEEIDDWRTRAAAVSEHEREIWERQRAVLA